MALESSPASGLMRRRAALDYFQLCQNELSEESEEQDNHDEDSMWTSVSRRSRGSRALRPGAQKGIYNMTSQGREAQKEIGSVASGYALLSGDKDDDGEEGGNADGVEGASVANAPKPDVLATSCGHKGGKASKERAGSGQKTTKTRTIAEEDFDWLQEAEAVIAPEAGLTPSVQSAKEGASYGKFGSPESPIGCSTIRNCRPGITARRSGSAPSAMATMAFAAELLAIVAGIAPETQEAQSSKGKRHAQPRQQSALVMQRTQRSSRGSGRQQPLTYARGSRR